MDSLPSDVREKLEQAIASVVESKADDMLGAIADALKPPSPSPIDTRSAEAFNASMMNSGVATMHLSLIGLGDELGFFQALLAGAKSSDDLAKATECDARYVKEWCLTMLAGKVLEYDNGLYSVMPAIRECVKINEDPAGLLWGTMVPVAIDVRSKLVDAFRQGGGIDWRDRDPRLPAVTCNFFKPLYEGMLVETLPDYIKAKLEEGGTLADVGCGSGLSSCLLAKAFPKATIKGYDYSAPSIEMALAMAKERELGNTSFTLSGAEVFGDHDHFDVACFLDCFHDMCVAKAAAKRACEVIKPGGYCFLIEPMAAEEDSVEAQVALPTLPMMGAFSCHVCLCCGKCNNGDGLGTVCPTHTYKDIFAEAGFSKFETIEHPVNAAGFRFMVATK